MIRSAGAATAALLLALSAAAEEAEGVVFDAFALLSASGAAIGTGEGAQSFAGSMSGPCFVDLGEGPLPAGVIACVDSLDAEADGRQTGAGRCRLVAEDGALAFGRFSCKGYRLVGCAGSFTIDGGEGRLAGVRGEGPITLRRSATTFATADGGAVTESAIGIASWKGFTLRHAGAGP